MGWLFNNPEDGSGEDTVAGVDVLRAIWNIQTEPPAREQAPPDVVTDIYNTPVRMVPPRSRRSR